MKKYGLLNLLLLMLLTPLFAQESSPNTPLYIPAKNTRLLRNDDGSYELYVLKVPGLESILLTDSTADRNQMTDNYALRAYDDNSTIANERRVLNGTYIDNKDRIAKNLEPLYFLVSSTARPVEAFKDNNLWFHIHLPKSVLYGYPWGREGQFDFAEGTWFNIRAFALKDTDYGNHQVDLDYRDNPFILKTGEVKIERPSSQQVFFKIAQTTEGRFYAAKDSDEMVKITEAILSHYDTGSVDVVFVLDTTISMKKDMEYIKRDLVPNLFTQMYDKYPNRELRFGLVLYRDYPPDQYLTRSTPFTKDVEAVGKAISAITVGGGGDIPEAVYEGIYAALTELEWQGSTRIIIQIGDAPPHPVPKGAIDQAMVLQLAQDEKVMIFSILLPDSRFR